MLWYFGKPSSPRPRQYGAYTNVGLSCCCCCCCCLFLCLLFLFFFLLFFCCFKCRSQFSPGFIFNFQNLHKFSIGTLEKVKGKLNGITRGIKFASYPHLMILKVTTSTSIYNVYTITLQKYIYHLSDFTLQALITRRNFNEMTILCQNMYRFCSKSL